MKKTLLAAMVMLCICMISACGKKDEIVLSELASKLNSEIGFNEKLSELDDAASAGYVYLNPGEYKEIKAYVSTNAVVDEFIIIKTSSVSAVTNKINSHIEELKREYSEYRPDEIYKLDDAVVETYKDTVTLIISPENDKAKQVYDDYLKK